MPLKYGSDGIGVKLSVVENTFAFLYKVVSAYDTGIIPPSVWAHCIVMAAGYCVLTHLAKHRQRRVACERIEFSWGGLQYYDKDVPRNTLIDVIGLSGQGIEDRNHPAGPRRYTATA